MLGLLLGVVNKAEPSLPDFRFDKSADGVSVSKTVRRYGMGFRPDDLGEEEVIVASLQVQQDKDGFVLLVMKDHGRSVFRLTVPNSGRISNDGKSWQFDWQIDECTKELVQCLKNG